LAENRVRIEGLTRELPPEDEGRREERRGLFGAVRIGTPIIPGWTKRYILSHMARILPEELARLDAEIERLEAGGVPGDITLAAFLEMLEPPVPEPVPGLAVPGLPAVVIAPPAKPTLWVRLRRWLSRIWDPVS
jgi:hypothetical protein